MSVDFYGEWLRVPAGKRPPTYFDLLGLTEADTDPQIIAAAAALQAQRVKANQSGPHAEQCAKLMQEIAQAKAVLSNPEQRAKYVAIMQTKRAATATRGKDDPWWKAEIAGSPPKTAASKPATVAPPAHPAPPAPNNDSRPDLPDFAAAPVPARKKAGTPSGMLLVAGGAVVALVAAAVVGVALLMKPTPPATTQPVASATSKKEDPKLPVVQPAPKVIAVNADPVELLPKLDEQPVVSGAALEPRSFKRHTAIVQSLALAPNGRRFLSASLDQSILDWNINETASFRRHSFKTGAAAVAFLPNGRQAVCCDENTILVFDLVTNSIQQSWLYPRGNALCLAAAHDGKHILIAGSDGTLHWWDVTQPKAERDIDISDAVTVSSVALSADGQRVAAACSDGKIGVWEIATRKKLWHQDAHAGGATGIAFSSDGQRVASAGLDKSAAVWDAGNGKLTKRLNGHEQIALAVAFLADGKRIVSGGRDATVRMWDIASGSNIRTFPTPAAVHALAVDRDDRFALAGGFGGNLQLIPLKDALSDPSLQEKPPDAGYPVPGADDLRAATAAIKNAYKHQLDSKKPEELAVLLDQLLLRTLGKEPPPMRYVLFHEARDLAARMGRIAVALQTVESMDKWFEIDALAEKAAALAVAGTGPPVAQPSVVEAAKELLMVADKEQRPDLAKQLLQVMTDAAYHAGAAELVKKVEGLQKQRLEALTARDRTAKLVATLKEKPDDPEANLEYGLILCSQGSLKDGLPHLVKGSDKALAQLAMKELAPPKETKPVRELADGWFAASKTAADAKHLCLERAKYWYELVKPALSGEDKLEVSSRILALDEQLKPIAAASSAVRPRRSNEPISRRNFNTLRTEATAKSHWKFDTEYRIEALGFRMPQGKGTLTSQFQLVDNWKVIIVVVPEFHIDVEVNQESLGFDRRYDNAAMTIVVERKGKKLGYTAEQSGTILANNIIQLKDDRLGPSAIVIRATGFPDADAKRDGTIMSGVIVSGPIKMIDEKAPEKPKEKDKP